MINYDIRPMEERDLSIIARNARQPDIDELWAAAHTTPLEALQYSATVSRDTCYTGLADDKPVCVYGVKSPSMLSNLAVPWMIATKELEFHSRVFLRRSRDMVKLINSQFPYMHNYVDARNTVSIRWLQWVGFSVYYPEPYGVEGMPFHPFDMRS